MEGQSVIKTKPTYGTKSIIAERWSRKRTIEFVSGGIFDPSDIVPNTHIYGKYTKFL